MKGAHGRQRENISKKPGSTENAWLDKEVQVNLKVPYIDILQVPGCL